MKKALGFYNPMKKLSNGTEMLQNKVLLKLNLTLECVIMKGLVFYNPMKKLSNDMKKDLVFNNLMKKLSNGIEMLQNKVLLKLNFTLA
uniref:Uncharacterized protein n=1 Tax=Plectus sambesii TaxID=2011161 RepID=A0A914UMQ8_9BILA